MGDTPAVGGCCGLIRRLGEYIDEILWRKLYAVIFATSFWSVSMFRLHRCACVVVLVGKGGGVARHSIPRILAALNWRAAGTANMISIPATGSAREAGKL